MKGDSWHPVNFQGKGEGEFHVSSSLASSFNCHSRFAARKQAEWSLFFAQLCEKSPFCKPFSHLLRFTRDVISDDSGHQTAILCLTTRCFQSQPVTRPR